MCLQLNSLRFPFFVRLHRTRCAFRFEALFPLSEPCMLRSNQMLYRIKCSRWTMNIDWSVFVYATYFMHIPIPPWAPQSKLLSSLLTRGWWICLVLYSKAKKALSISIKWPFNNSPGKSCCAKWLIDRMNSQKLIGIIVPHCSGHWIWSESILSSVQMQSFDQNLRFMERILKQLSVWKFAD